MLENIFLSLKGKDMYILLITVFALWIYSLYTFARWRYNSCLDKGVVLETVLHDRLTQIYLICTTGIVLALVVYIIQVNTH
jgi:hypothetical protein